MTAPTLTRSDDRFWGKVRKTDGCWLWTGCIKHSGYGHFWRAGKLLHAHRVSWELTHGPVPEGLFVLHRCDTRACVRPDHLFTGTHQDNMLDMENKGRTGRNLGERNGRAKLTRDQVIEIRTLYATGDVTQLYLARLFGVSRALVWYILSGSKWSHLL
jgi:hypothetical protein